MTMGDSRVLIDDGIDFGTGESSVETGGCAASPLCHSLFGSFRQECLDPGLVSYV
jgi:hypothetical protein